MSYSINYLSSDYLGRGESVKPKRLCNPCRCGAANQSKRIKEGIEEKRTKKRASSANSVKSSPGPKKQSGNSSKLTSSDSQIIGKSIFTKTAIKTQKDQKSKINREHLKHDLDVIKQQLLLLNSRNDDSRNTSEITELKNKYKEKEEEIEELKNKNRRLLEQLQRQSQDSDIQDMSATKRCLDVYEEKLNTLYQEFLTTTDIMQKNRDKMCRCIHEKTSQYQDLLDSQTKLSEAVQQNETKYAQLFEKYQKARENEHKYQQQSLSLEETVKRLEAQVEELKKCLEAKKVEEQLAVKKQQQPIMEEQKRRSSVDSNSKMNGQEVKCACCCNKGKDKQLPTDKQTAAKLQLLRKSYEQSFIERKSCKT